MIGDPRRYGAAHGYLAKETLTLPEGKSIDEMIPVWLAQGKLERIQEPVADEQRPIVLNNEWGTGRTVWPDDAGGEEMK